MAQIVILGGGFGGAATAKALRSTGHDVVLVDARAESYLCGVNPAVIVGAAEPVSRSIASLAGDGVEFLMATIEDIDLDARTVRTGSSTIPYDVLVVALGVTYDWNAVPGALDGYSFYDQETTLRLRTALDRFDGGSIVIGVGGSPYRCPPAPFEAALMVDGALRERGIRQRSTLTVAIPEQAPMGVAGPATSDRIRGILEAAGISLLTGIRATSVTRSSITFSGGTTLEADVPITVPVHRLPPVLAATGLAGDLPFIPVNPSTLETSVSNVFAIGDTNGIPVGEKAGIPKAGVFASGQGTHVARVIAHRLGSAEDPGPYDGVGHCFLMLGRDRGAKIGGDFYADGGPDVSLDEPSAAGRQAKDEWEAAWKRFDI